MQRLLQVLLGIVIVPLLGMMCSIAQADSVRIEQAMLIAGGVERKVSLPHHLKPSDFDRNGSTITYRLTFDMPAASDGLQAIYIAKLSLSGRLIHNGQPFWACGAAELPELRCLHRPHLIQLPARFLDPGLNVLEFEIFADGQQMNGLSPVIVGPYVELFNKHYRPMRFLKVDLIFALAIFAGVAGLLSLSAAAAAPGGRLFLVFAAAAIFESIAAFLMFNPMILLGDKEISSWLIFNARYVAVLLKLLLLFEAFGRLRLRDPFVVYFIMLMMLGPVALAMTASNLRVVLVLYLLLGIGMAAALVRILRWTYVDPSLRNMAWTALAVIIFFSSLHDYLRLGGSTTFDGVYLLYYVFPITMIIMGFLLFGQIATGLRVAQDFALSLSKEVGARTIELESALASIRSMESSALRLTRNIPIGTFILHTWDHETARYTFFSERLLNMINLPHGTEAPLFSQVAGLLHPGDVKRSCAIFRNAIDDLARVETEFRVRSTKGDWRWMRCIMLPQTGSKAPAVWDGVVIDVTEAREAEERLRIANASLVEDAAEQSRLEERERLLRDVHDGFGSQLSSARLAIENGKMEPDAVAHILLEASEDLRLIVDALGNTDGDLINAMADYRYRTERRLLGTGIAIEWDITIAEETRLPPTVTLQILRVLQEATNNALRHSGSKQLKVTVKAEAGRLSAILLDDGKGLDGAAKGGRGMANMKKRCREIGARLEVAETGMGTMVALTMELPDAH